MHTFRNLFPADILLPREDFEKFAVIACDQYTAEPEYWEKADEIAGNAPSALRLILPEAFLGKNDDEAVERVNLTMRDYLNNGIFRQYENSMIYVERKITGGKIRHGIIGTIDLEQFDYNKGSKTPIRATEATVLERIPPRVKIRRDAPLELPHVLLLIDDPSHSVIEPFSKPNSCGETLYDFSLMLSGGHITGKLLDADASARVDDALSALATGQTEPMLFAVGDGNHSLAAARECYRQNPSEKSRYALVEIVNIHDDAIEFEPIYRAVFGVEPEQLIKEFVADSGGEYTGENAQTFKCVYASGEKTISVRPDSSLAVGTLQQFLDRYIANNDGVTVDYIHGIESLKRICSNENRVGFIFDGMKKSELFSAVRKDGALPRKTFSMGHSDDKRFYLEARRLK